MKLLTSHRFPVEFLFLFHPGHDPKKQSDFGLKHHWAAWLVNMIVMYWNAAAVVNSAVGLLFLAATLWWKWTKLPNRLYAMLQRLIFRSDGVVKALRGWRCGCVKDDSEYTWFETGEKEVWRGKRGGFQRGWMKKRVVEEGIKGKGWK